MNKTTLNSTSFDLTPYEWKEGDLITSEKLNALEALKTAYSEQASTIEAMSEQIAEIGDSEIKTVKLNTLSELYYYPGKTPYHEEGIFEFFVPGNDLLPSLVYEERDSYICGIYYTYEPGLIMYQETDFVRGENRYFSGVLGENSRLIGTVTLEGREYLKLIFSRAPFVDQNAMVLALKIRTKDGAPIFSSSNPTRPNDADVYFLKSISEYKIYDVTDSPDHIDGNDDGRDIFKGIIQYENFPLLFATRLFK